MKIKLVKESLIEGLGDKFLSNQNIVKDDVKDYEKEYAKQNLTSNQYDDVFTMKSQFFNKNKILNIYKNPKSLDFINSHARGIILANGDLYLSESTTPFHHEIVHKLVELNIINRKFSNTWGSQDPMKEGFLAIQRIGNTINFKIAETNSLSFDDDTLTKQEKIKLYNDTLNFIDKINSSQDVINIIKQDFIKEGLGDKFLYNQNIIKDEDNDYDKEYAKKNLEIDQYDDIFTMKSKYGSDYENKIYKIYKNPKSLDFINKDARGIILTNGDLYLSEEPKPIHHEILEYLSYIGIIDKKYKDRFGWYSPQKEGFLAIQRIGLTNNFKIGESNYYAFRGSGIPYKKTNEFIDNVNKIQRVINILK